MGKERSEGTGNLYIADFGNNRVRVVSGSVPTATTGAAGMATAVSDTVNGSVNPQGRPIGYHFEYGTTTAYEASQPVPDQSVGSDHAEHPESQTLENLTPGTTYHYRIVATYDEAGTTISVPGADATFTTERLPISVLGNSGAGSLYCLYQAQAVTAPLGRLTDTAAGDPYDLNAFTMPPADGMIFLGAHLGAGKILQTEIDPAVIDENDPLSCDPELNMYRPANGFREPPEYSTYPDEFLARYRNAQVGRVERIDAIAREHIRNPRPFRYLQVFRLDANPGSTSRPLPSSRRTYGSFMSVRSSETIFEASPASDKSRAQFEGDHFGLTPAFERKPRGPKSAATVILEWLRARY